MKRAFLCAKTDTKEIGRVFGGSTKMLDSEYVHKGDFKVHTKATVDQAGKGHLCAYLADSYGKTVKHVSRGITAKKQ
jgi:hypothetical protein